MKIKLVKQFICDFCGKKQYALGAMRRHERHCTSNPSRECRMCAYTPDGCSSATLAELVAILSDEEELPKERMRKVRMETDCPACILAAIRQSGIWSVYADEPCDCEIGEDKSMERTFCWNSPFGAHTFLGFDYKAEKDAMLSHYRDQEMRRCNV